MVPSQIASKRSVPEPKPKPKRLKSIHWAQVNKEEDERIILNELPGDNELVTNDLHQGSAAVKSNGKDESLKIEAPQSPAVCEPNGKDNPDMNGLVHESNSSKPQEMKRDIEMPDVPEEPGPTTATKDSVKKQFFKPFVAETAEVEKAKSRRTNGEPTETTASTKTLQTPVIRVQSCTPPATTVEPPVSPIDPSKLTPPGKVSRVAPPASEGERRDLVPYGLRLRSGNAESKIWRYTTRLITDDGGWLCNKCAYTDKEGLRVMSLFGFRVIAGREGLMELVAKNKLSGPEALSTASLYQEAYSANQIVGYFWNPPLNIVCARAVASKGTVCTMVRSVHDADSPLIHEQWKMKLEGFGSVDSPEHAAAVGHLQALRLLPDTCTIPRRRLADMTYPFATWNCPKCSIEGSDWESLIDWLDTNGLSNIHELPGEFRSRSGKWTNLLWVRYVLESDRYVRHMEGEKGDRITWENDVYSSLYRTWFDPLCSNLYSSPSYSASTNSFTANKCNYVYGMPFYFMKALKSDVTISHD